MDDDSISTDNGSVVIYTTAELLKRGLLLVNYTRRRIRRAKKKRNLERFVGHFGANPTIVAQIWEDLQTTNDDAAYLVPDDRNIDHLFMALHHLKRCPTELEREPIFDVDCTSGKDFVRFFIQKVKALKHEKIRWPDNNFGNDIWAITVDGTHIWIEEPQHPTWSQDSKCCSHKHGSSGMSYELGISISTSKLVWINGPFPAGRSDNSIFKKDGLKAKLESMGKRCIGDGGYPGHPKVLSTPNEHDSKPVRVFKSRALKRHETFNGMVKRFDCLSSRFRHSADWLEDCFEAVCVVCQHQCDFDQPLFDVLVDGLLEK